jgi:general secretion pathway protein I
MSDRRPIELDRPVVLWGDCWGFTLIEVMISLAITAGLIITLLYTVNYHLGLADRQEVLTTATSLARMKIQEMEKNPSTAKGNFNEPFSGYYYETVVRESTFPSMAEISVTVWSEGERVRLSELVSNKR